MIEVAIDNSVVENDPLMTGIGTIVMRSKSGFSPRPCRTHADPQAAMWKAVVRLSLAAILFAVPAHAQTTSTYVSGVGSDANPCTAASPCRTLQAAVARTAPGGQILPLDSANYGYVTIKQAVSILNGRGATGVLATSSLTGVNINAGAADVITLQGLDIDGAGSGGSGVQFNSGASLNIQDSVIRGFSNGINFQPSGSSALVVSRTLISNNSTGINLHGAAATTAVLNDVQLVGNGTGLAATGASSSALANVAIQNGVIANNSTVGIAAGASSTVSVASSTITNNAVGLRALAASSQLPVSNSTLTGNRVAWQATNGGQVLSGGQNAFGGNTGGDTAPRSAPAPASASAPASAPASDPTAPAAVSCNFQTGIAIGVGAGTCIASPTVCDGVTDNTASFAAFVTWAITWQATHSGQVQLFIPPGRTCYIHDTGTQFLNGIKNLLIVGYGVTLNGPYNHVGLSAMFFDKQHSVRTAAITAGDSFVIINPSAATQESTGCQTIGAGTAVANCAALFTAGNWVAVGGIDLQTGDGFPPNQAFAQYAQITGVNSITGVISLDRTLRDSYKTTWPHYESPYYDLGGPATLFAMDPGWGGRLEWRGITFNPDNGRQLDTDGLNITLTDVSCISSGSPVCFAPSMIFNATWNNVKTPYATLEMDKMVENLTINNSSGQVFFFQSAGSFRNVTINNSTYYSIVGTPQFLTLNNVNLTAFYPGPQLYGSTKSLIIQNSSIVTVGTQETQQFYGCSATPEGLNNASGWTMSGGVLTIPNAYIITACVYMGKPAFGWMFPGANLCWADSANACAIMFQITDITQDAVNTYVYTNAPSCEMACWSFAGGKLGITPHPVTSATFANNSGDFQLVGWNSAPAGAPLYSYSKTTKTRANSGTTQYLEAWGTLQKLTANVTLPYGGVLASNATPNTIFGNWVTTAPAFTAYTPAIINVKNAGTRTLDATAGAPASWSCSPACSTLISGGDTLNNLSQALWGSTLWVNVTNDTTSDMGNDWSLTVVVITAQNVVP
jgi:hypothetical protein